jgi:5'-nucleotidase
MPRKMGKIRVIMSSRILFDLETADDVFKTKGIAAYTDFMRAVTAEHKAAYDPDIKARRLEEGIMLPFAKRLLAVNDNQKESIVELIISCKDQSDTAGIIFANLEAHGLGSVEMRISTCGNAITPQDLKAFGTDVFLTRNFKDAQTAINTGVASAQIFLPETKKLMKAYNKAANRSIEEPPHIVFDGDAVAFGSSAEAFYREHGLDHYRVEESKQKHSSIEQGPFTNLLQKLTALNAEQPNGSPLFKLSLLTARGAEASTRLMTIFEEFGIRFNGFIICAGGSSKADVLKAYKPDLFLDDQETHLKESCLHCPTGLVPYHKDSAMAQFLSEKEARERMARIPSDPSPYGIG